MDTEHIVSLVDSNGANSFATLLQVDVDARVVASQEQVAQARKKLEEALTWNIIIEMERLRRIFLNEGIELLELAYAPLVTSHGDIEQVLVGLRGIAVDDENREIDLNQGDLHTGFDEDLLLEVEHLTGLVRERHPQVRTLVLRFAGIAVTS